MLSFASPQAGYLCDRFGCRITTCFGGLLCITGLISTSFLQSLTPMYFTYSLVFSLGTCFIFNSCFLVIGQYFEEKLSTATGIVALGASFGVLYTGPLLQVLLDLYGWRGALKITAACFALVCVISLAFNSNVENITLVETITNNGKEENKSKGISLYCSVWTFPAFTVIVISLTFASFGMNIIYINLVSRCIVYFSPKSSLVPLNRKGDEIGNLLATSKNNVISKNIMKRNAIHSTDMTVEGRAKLIRFI